MTAKYAVLCDNAIQCASEAVVKYKQIALKREYRLS